MNIYIYIYRLLGHVRICLLSVQYIELSLELGRTHKKILRGPRPVTHTNMMCGTLSHPGSPSI